MATQSKVMDDKTRPIHVYIAKPNFTISNDDTIDSDNVVDKHQWGGRWSCYTTIEYNNKRRY
jgi:hypothetical protein